MYLTLSLLFLWPASSRLPVSRRLCLPDVGTSGLSRSGGAVLDAEHVELGSELVSGGLDEGLMSLSLYVHSSRNYLRLNYS